MPNLHSNFIWSFKKIRCCFALLVIIVGVTIFPNVLIKLECVRLFDLTDYSKPPPLPDWTSISVTPFRQVRIETDSDRSRNASHVLSTSSSLSVDTAYSLQWIVITSIYFPTETIRKLSQLKDWALVLVADTSTPSNWSHPNCVFLSIEHQRRLLLETHDTIPYRHYGRKNIGYLYAIRHGAKIIYETDDDNELISGIEDQVLHFQEISTSRKAYFLPANSQKLNSFSPKPYLNASATANSTHHQTMEEEQITVNPYHYFGQTTIWPRGYPLRLIEHDTSVSISLATVQPLIQQGLANGDPDVDAIFRLTRSNRHKKLSIQFEKKPPIAIPQGLFVPFNSQNTLFHYDAFWALWLPITTTFRVCDIWRGYFVQRLLRELDPHARLTFHSASVLQLRNPHNYLRDFEEELQLYTQAERLILFLRKWTCLHGGSHLRGVRDCKPFFNQIYFLAVDMAEAKFWKMKDAWLCVNFLTDLVKNGYNLNLNHGTSSFEQKKNSTMYPNVAPDKNFPPTRVAVCVSGQPRTLNMMIPKTLPGMNVDKEVYKPGSTWRKLRPSRQTAAMNIQSLLFDKLPAFDVFMFVSTKEKHPREPRVNDTSICEPLRPRSPSNRLFCSVVREIDINNPSTNLPAFDKYVYADTQEFRQGLLQQLNGLRQCNAMRKEYSQKSGTQYTHWIRLRPDSVFLEPFPDIRAMRFVTETTDQPVVVYANKTKCCCGNEDWFGVGTIETMNAYFDRIDMLQNFKTNSLWSAENFAEYALSEVSNAQLLGNNPLVQVCIYKPADRKALGDP